MKFWKGLCLYFRLRCNLWLYLFTVPISYSLQTWHSTYDSVFVSFLIFLLFFNPFPTPWSFITNFPTCVFSFSEKEFVHPDIFFGVISIYLRNPFKIQRKIVMKSLHILSACCEQKAGFLKQIQYKRFFDINRKILRLLF